MTCYLIFWMGIFYLKLLSQTLRGLGKIKNSHTSDLNYGFSLYWVSYYHPCVCVFFNYCKLLDCSPMAPEGGWYSYLKLLKTCARIRGCMIPHTTRLRNRLSQHAFRAAYVNHFHSLWIYFSCKSIKFEGRQKKDKPSPGVGLKLNGTV